MDTTYEVEEDFAFLGRTYTEYGWFFDLSMADLTQGPVLDCAAGPSSFTAVASSHTAVTAVDPAYAYSIDELEARCVATLERTSEQLREKAGAFVWDVYGDVDTRMGYLRAATRRFLADVGHHPERYVAAELPDLPFERNAFSLALSANFLFLYDDRLDRSFHVAALRELARVASEVRIFPLHGLDGDRSPLREPVRSALAADGISTTLCSVPYEFQPGATEMLVVGESPEAGQPG